MEKARWAFEFTLDLSENFLFIRSNLVDLAAVLYCTVGVKKNSLMLMPPLSTGMRVLDCLVCIICTGTGRS